MGNKWEPITENARKWRPYLAPDSFLKSNSFYSFSGMYTGNTNKLKAVLENGRWSSSKISHCKYIDGDIPYLDHGVIYKNNLFCALVYIPYLQWDVSINEMIETITKWAESNELRVSAYRESWYHPDSFVVIVTLPLSYTEVCPKWTVDWYNGRMTNMLYVNPNND